MHPRNIYKSPPDFSKLAIQYPEFLKISSLDLNGTVRINFKDPASLRILTKCLLHSDFDLDVDIPSDRLVPTVPLRLNYLLWLEDLLESAGRNRNIFGIDIGTGACCIYPLLASKKFQWKMLATEFDENSVNMALKNIKQNELQEQISVKKATNENQLLLHCFEAFGGSLNTVDFCMCNPPFYASVEDMDLSRNNERDPPRNARTGSVQEVVTEGGEVAFVDKMIRESLSLKERVTIYTTMLGHKSSLKPLLKTLKDFSVTQITQTTFVQGRTMRWGLAWSFVDSSNLLKALSPSKNKPKNKCLSFAIPQIKGVNYKVKDITLKLLQIFKILQMECKILQNKDVICTMEIKAPNNTWSNQRKKRREIKFMQSKDSNCNIKEESSAVENVTATKIDSKIINRNSCDNDKHPKLVIKNDIEIVNHESIKRNIAENDTSCKKIKFDCDNSLDIISSKSTSSKCDVKETTYEKSFQFSESAEKANVGKIDEPSTSKAEDKIGDPYLTAAVCVRNHESYIVLEIGYVSGQGGKDGVHQIVQYIKNNWK